MLRACARAVGRRAREARARVSARGRATRVDAPGGRNPETTRATATTGRRLDLDAGDRRRDDVVVSENRARDGSVRASNASPTSGGGDGVSANVSVNDDASTRERETDVERLSRELLCEEIELEERGGDAALASPAHLEAEALRLRRMADDLERDAERLSDKVQRRMRQRARELFRIAHERRDESEEMFARARLLRESSRRQSRERDDDDDDDGDIDPRKFRFRPA